MIRRILASGGHVIMLSLALSSFTAATASAASSATAQTPPAQEPAASSLQVQPQAAAQADSNSAHTGSVVEPESVTQDAAVIPLSAELERRARALNEQLRCPVCQSSSIEESPAREATEMKTVIRKQLAEGKSDEEIIDYFLSRYGDWVMLAPPRRGFNLAVYILPVLLVLGGAVFVYLTARKWVANSA